MTQVASGSLKGRFSSTGAMAAPRDEPVAVPLSDGRVLVAGGLGSLATAGNGLASAEIWDPGTGRFSPTGSMTTARVLATATRLHDGRVLVVGGSTGIGDLASALASAELYDPATGTFSRTDSLTTARVNQTATLLQDGRVLIAGGSDRSGLLSSSELYDPTTGSFTATGSLGYPRALATATLLADGRVLIAGGGGPTASLASSELYDPKTGDFSATGSMTVSREGHTATLLPDGSVLVAGGVTQANGGGSVLASAELYDPAAGAFSVTGSMSTPRVVGTATPLDDGRVLVAGGLDRTQLSSAELYEPVTRSFVTTGSMGVARQNAVAVHLVDDRVLILGGMANGGILGSAEVFVP